MTQETLGGIEHIDTTLHIRITDNLSLFAAHHAGVGINTHRCYFIFQPSHE